MRYRLAPYYLFLFHSLYFVLGPTCTLSSQSLNNDSLLNVLWSSKNDTGKIRLMNEISDGLTWEGYFAKSDSFANKALQLAQKVNDKKGMAEAYNHLGIDYYYKDGYAKALDQYFAAYKLGSDIGNKQEMATALMGIGEVYQDEGDDTSTLKEDNKALHMYMDVNYELGEADVLIDMGWSYDALAEDSTAFEKGLEAEILYEKVGNKDGIAAAYDLLGKVYENKADYKNALTDYLKSLILKREINNNDGIATSLLYVANVYLKQGKYREAFENASESLTVSNKINSSNDIMEAERGLSDIHLTMGNLKEAMIHFKNYTHLHDSIYGPKNTKKIVQAQLNYKYQIQQAEERAAQEKKEAIYQQELKGLGILSVILLLIIGLLLFIRRQRNIINEKDKLVNLMKLIKEGENNKIEFKSTMRYDLKQGKVDVGKVEFSTIKTLAAFLNSEGGTLIIGTDDDKNILGLEETDFASFPKPNKKDEWSKHFDNLLQNFFGNAIHSLLKMEFVEIDGKTVSLITVKKSPHAVWIKDEKKVEVLFIRRTSSSIPLQGHEAVNFVNQHWI